MKNKYALHSQKCPKWPFLEVFFDAFLNARLQGPKNMIFGFSMKFPFRKGMSRPYLKIFFFRPLESIFFPLVPVTEMFKLKTGELSCLQYAVQIAWDFCFLQLSKAKNMRYNNPCQMQQFAPLCDLQNLLRHPFLILNAKLQETMAGWKWHVQEQAPSKKSM